MVEILRNTINKNTITHYKGSLIFINTDKPQNCVQSVFDISDATLNIQLPPGRL